MVKAFVKTIRITTKVNYCRFFNNNNYILSHVSDNKHAKINKFMPILIDKSQEKGNFLIKNI